MKWGCGRGHDKSTFTIFGVVMDLKRPSSLERMTPASSSSSSSPSTSRLSALASPFTLKNHGSVANKQDELKLLHSSECNTSARVLKTSDFSTMLLSKPVLQKDLDSCGDAVIINNENHFNSHSSTMMGPHSLQDAKDKEVLPLKIAIDKGREERNCQVINEAIDPLITKTRELLNSSQNVVNDVSLEAHGAQLSICVQNTAVMSDQDSDVDSPCWKGTGVSQSTSQVSQPLTQQLPKTDARTRKRLNPLAPHFIPESARRQVEYHDSEYIESDPLCFQQTASSVVSFSSTENVSIASFKTGMHPSEVSSIVGSPYSNGIRDARNFYVPPNESTKISLPDYLSGDQLQLIEDRHTSNCQDVMGCNVAGPFKSNKNAINRGSTNVSFTVRRNVLTSSCSQEAVSSNFNNTRPGASKSTPPKIDVQSLINTMCDLSELLMSNHLDSINEHDHDTIQHIIHNLKACTMNEVGQRASKHESGHPCTSYSPMKLLDGHKECQITRMKAMSVLHDWGREKSCCSMFSKPVLISCPRRDGSIKMDDTVTQLLVFRKAMKDAHLINKEMQHRAMSGKLSHALKQN